MSKILEQVLEEFSKLSAIPRPSKQEYKVAAYLVDRLKRLGAEVIVDRVGNVIGEVPASEGMEKEPIVALQAHMDMVCVSDGRVKYSPMQDGIKLKREGGYLRAEGTSLGADDGIGIAIIIYLIENMKVHGRWRVIFTVDEESGMSGARGLSVEYLRDVEYLINVDSESAEELVLGSAGSVHVEYVKKLEWEEPRRPEGYMIKVRKLRGGHSGEAIGEKRANAIKVLGEVLRRLQCEISMIGGGTAPNAIASEAQAIVTLGEESVEGAETARERLQKVCAEVEEEVRRKYDEPEVTIQARGVRRPRRVMRWEDSRAIIELLFRLKSGVFEGERSKKGKEARTEGFDMTSANIGLLKNTSTAAYLYYMPRFHSEEGFREISRHVSDKYVASGFDEIKMSGYSNPWPFEDNKLARVMLEVAREQGRTLEQRVIHGGLECSHFIVKNGALQIVSVGTTNLDIHSPKERLELASVEPTVKLIMGTLERLTSK